MNLKEFSHLSAIGDLGETKEVHERATVIVSPH
jgi:hypothetical protein